MKRLIALTLAVLPAFGFAKQPSMCDAQVLKKLLFSDVPGYRRVTDTINALVLQPEKPRNKECLTAIAASAELQAHLKAGREFREAYLKIFEQDFSTAGEVELALTPEQAMLERIYAQVEFGNKRRGEAPPKDWEIRQRALSETLTRFGLPRSMNTSDFEKFCRNNPTYYVAIEHFKRLENRLRENMRSTGPTTLRSPEQFKAMMLEQINRVRVRNLQSAARQALNEWRSHTVEFKDVRTGEKHLLRLEDLVAMPVQIISVDAGQSGDSKLKQGLEKSRGGLGTFLARRWIDYIEEYYKPAPTPISQSLDTVQLTASDGRPFFISEADLLKTLETLSPRAQTEYFGKDAVQMRYRVEAAAREVQLTNSAGFLRGQIDKTFEDLYKRVKERIDNRIFDQEAATPYLTYEINIGGSLTLEPSTQTDVLWNGWRLNPQHWKLREDSANRINAPDYVEFTFANDEVANPKMDKALAKASAKEERRVAWRYLSENGRVARLGKRTLTKTAKTLAMIGAAYLLYNTDYSTAKDFLLTQLPSISISKPDISVPQVPWDFSGFLKMHFPLINMSGDGVMSMDQPIAANNNNVPKADQDGHGGAGKKYFGDAHDPTNSDYAIEVIYNPGKAPIPNYFNFANRENLPAIVTESTSEADYEYTSKLNRITDYGTWDTMVDVNVRNRKAEGGRIGLMQMQGFELHRIELYDWKHRLVPSTDYHLYTVVENHQNFATLSKDHWGPFTYRAYYKYTPTRYNSGQLSHGVSKENVMHVVTRLQKSGFTDLVESIPKAETQGGMDLNDLAYRFQASSTYFYDGKTWSQNSSADPAFKGFTQFLVNGHLYYQCTGSNLLYQAFLNEVFKDANETDKKAVPLVGFRANSDGVKRGSQGHLHTLILAKNYRGDADYLEVDATPYGSQPGPPADAASQAKKENEAKAKAEKQNQESEKAEREKAEKKQSVRNHAPFKPEPLTIFLTQPGNLPQAPRIDNEPEELKENTPAEPVKPQATANPSTPPPRPAFTPRNILEIERILKRIRDMRKIAVDAVKPVYSEVSALHKYDFVDMPGLRLIALSNRLLDAFAQLQEPAMALADLEHTKGREIRPRMSDEEAIFYLDSLFHSELISFRKSIEGIEKQATVTDKVNTFEFLLNDPVRGRVRELTEALAAYPWGTLLDQYITFKKAEMAQKSAEINCEDRLKKAN